MYKYNNTHTQTNSYYYTLINIDHDQEEETTVSGYEGPGEYIGKVNYIDADENPLRVSEVSRGQSCMYWVLDCSCEL